MGHSEELHKLVTSLEPAEKRYFRRFSGLHSDQKENLDLKLFQAINEQEQYDEAGIKKRFNGEKFLKQLSVAKHHLMEQVLKSLRLYSQGRTMGLTFREQLDYIELLYEKGLYKLCKKRIKTTLKRAKELEAWWAVYEILGKSLILTKRMAERDMGEILEREGAERQEALTKLNNAATLNRFHNRMYAMIGGAKTQLSPAQQEEIQSVQTHPLMQDESKALSFDAKIDYHYTWIHSLFAQGKRKELIPNYKRLLELWEEAHPKRRELESRHYLRVLQGYLESCFEVKAYDEIERTLPFLQAIKPRSRRERARIFNYTQNSRLLYFLNTLDLEPANEAIPEIAKGLKTYAPYLHKGTAITYYYNFAVICFLREAFDKSLYWLTRIINEGTVSARGDLQASARLLLLIVHFEQEDYDLLENKLRATKRYLGESLYEYERMLIKGFRALMKFPPGTGRRETYRKLQEDLGKLLKEKALIIHGHLEADLWMQSRIEGRPIREVMKDKLG